MVQYLEKNKLKLALHLLVSTVSPTPALIALHNIRTEGDLSDLNGFGRKQAHQKNKCKGKKKHMDILKRVGGSEE